VQKIVANDLDPNVVRTIKENVKINCISENLIEVSISDAK